MDGESETTASLANAAYDMVNEMSMAISEVFLFIVFVSFV